MAPPVKNKSFMAHYIPYKDYKQKELYGKYLRAATYALDDSDKFTTIISLIPRDWSEQFFSETIEEDNLEPEWTDLLEFINKRTALYKDSTGPVIVINELTELKLEKTKDAMTSLLDKVTNHARGLDVKQFNPQEFLTITSFIAKIPRSYQLELCADGCLPSLDDIRKFAFKKDREFSIKKKEYANNNVSKKHTITDKGTEEIKTLKPKPEKKWLGNNKAKDQQVTSEKKPLITISKKKEVPSEMLQTLMESICTAPIKLECVGKTFTAKIDTCAGIFLIGNQLFNRLPPSIKEKINLNNLITTKSAHDTCRTHKGSLELDFTLPNEKLMSGKFFLSGNDDTAITIGFDTIQKNFIDIRKYMKPKPSSHESHLIHNIKVTLGEECETIVEFLNDPKNINLIQEDVNFTPILNSDLPLKGTFKPKIAPLLPVKAEILPTVCNMLESEIEKGWLKYAKEPITSAGNLIVVHQHNEKIRLCYNIRNINDHTPDPDEINLPSLKSLLETPLDNVVTFTKLDISDAYRSIGINESDQWKTAVRTPIGTLVSTRLIFGHKLSPQIFCQALDEALSGIPFLKCYMDDLLILAPYGKEDDTIISTLKALKEAGFRINLKKSEFKVKSTTYLGLVWDIENGISIPEDKVKSILSMSSPTSNKDLHTKICKMAFYSNMVVNFSELAAPFFDLIGKKEKMKELIWSDELETQFRKLTNTFAQSIHLFAIPSKLSKVHATISTASRSALCILDAENDKKKRSIFYIHERKLKPTKQRYIPEQKGLMILCEALSQHINITTACPIIVHSNKNLTKLINNQIIPSSASSSFQKYLTLLLPFQLTGSSMKVNDHLVSELRYPISDISTEADLTSLVESLELIDFLKFTPLDKMTLTEAYKFDDLTVLLKEVATHGWNDDLKFKAPAFIRKYAVTVSNDIILLDQRLYIPPQLVQIILESLHGMHESDGYMIKVAKTKYVFQNFSTLIKQFYLSCSICMTYRKNSKKKVTTWSPTSIPRERYCLDYFTFEGHNFLTVVDDFSFFINCFKVKSMDSDTLVKTLIKAFNNMGTPYACVSDNFKSFKCSKYVQFMEEIGVQVIYSIPYQSNTNGKAEKAVDVLKSAMLKLVKDKDHKRTIHECMDMAIQKNHRTVRIKMIDGREITKTIEQFFFNTIILSEDQINKHFFQPIKMEETIKFKLTKNG